MKLITTKQLAERMGVSMQRICRLRNSGRTPGAQRIGREWFYPDGIKIEIYVGAKPGYITPKELAERLGVSVSRVRQLNAMGRTPGAVKNDRGKWMYPEEMKVYMRPDGRPTKYAKLVPR